MSWALVLSGGGLAALAWQAGLLAGLRDGGADLARPDLVVGTGAGALMGARLPASGGLDDLVAALRGAGTGSLLVRSCVGDAEPWPVALQLTALDAEAGALRVWTRSAGVPLVDAVGASCGPPFVAEPPTIEGRVYHAADPLSLTSAQLAFGHRLVIVLAPAAAGPLEDEIAQLRAGGSHVRVMVPDAASALGSAAAGYAQGMARAATVREWLESRHTLMPEVDAEDLAARFAVPSLRDAEWTHVAHLAVGVWHVDRYGADDALTRLRDGIRRLNVSLGGTNTPSSGYHETITAAYVRLIAAFLEACPPGLPLGARVDRLLASPLAGRDMLFTFYSRERLLSTEARATWMEPDLAPLRLDVVVGSHIERA
jgi:hypothetical protein